MQQGLGLSLKDDLLSQLGGEITLEVDGIAKDQPAWRAILQVNDSARLQQTFNKLLATAPVSERQSSEGGITYHSLTVPSQTKSMGVGYAFVDGYLILASSGDSVREAVRLHRQGGSLAKSSNFLAALPPGHSTQMSALYYSDPMKALGLQLARFSPELAQSFSLNSGESKPAVICAYGEESTIREASTSQGVDVGMVLVMAAVAIPNMVRAKSSADEASAVGTLRTMVTAQATYSVAYPARGYSRDLARLGVDPTHPDNVTPQHAGLLDASFAKPTCTAGTWCEKSGYKFMFAPSCPRLLCQEFVAIGTPVANGAGKSFCATSDGVVRVKAALPLFTPISAAECRSWTPLQ
jgi:type II secretory pathway pseudopilin PulG